MLAMNNHDCYSCIYFVKQINSFNKWGCRIIFRSLSDKKESIRLLITILFVLKGTQQNQVSAGGKTYFLQNAVHKLIHYVQYQ